MATLLPFPFPRPRRSRRPRAGRISAVPLRVRWLVVAVGTAALAITTGTAITRAVGAADASDIQRVAVVSHPAPTASVADTAAAPLALGDTLLGASGALRARFVPAGELSMLAGDARPVATGVYDVPGGIDGHPFSLIALHAFSLKVGPTVGDYYVGYWPAERRRVHSAAYANPAGFIEVTPANEDTWVSQHFRLRDFLTHDQPTVWPKYVVLREALLDKLELVLRDLSLRGIPTGHVVVLSGFRTPAYNFALGDASGRARESRHQYGDAADIIIDANGDGRMDDLNWDGRVDTRDVRVVEQAVTRVERRYPELAGGLGLYAAMGPHGPFAHIDVRGETARWTRGTGARSRSAYPPRAARVGHCYATGASAVLCRVRH
ncbi:MAG TPA: hypothetical protein VFS44_15610 [Gemmatimonadaceae bacterium]|nr:hypothetical protein [Gemmatimonadaceae bacterium]